MEKKSSPCKRTDCLYQGQLYTRAQMLEMSLTDRLNAEPTICKALLLGGFALLGWMMGCAI